VPIPGVEVNRCRIETTCGERLTVGTLQGFPSQGQPSFFASNSLIFNGHELATQEVRRLALERLPAAEYRGVARRAEASPVAQGRIQA